jgi:hypothetical protein
MLNAFQTVRPRGADAAATATQPRKTNTSKAPMEGNVHLTLDRNGRRTVPVDPRPSGITIESREQKLASEAKTARIAGGVLK